MDQSVLARRVEAVRHFSRFYTKKIGTLNESLHQSPFSLTEARVVYELAHHDETTATELGQELGLDSGYLSRMVSRFHKEGLVEKRPSPSDGRQSLLSLTPRGETEFSKINASSRNEIGAMLATLADEEQEQLVQSLSTVERLLGDRAPRKVPYLLRPHQPGDMGWVVHRHAVLYAQEYGWNEQFEALVAEIVADFLKNYDPRWERCWMAEMEGEIVGSVFVVKGSERVAKLRLLLVEPTGRGYGIGSRLVEECIRFARQAGYKTLTLWTNSVLSTARHIYQRAGFELVDEEPHHSFGADLVGQTWELEL